MSFAEKLEKLKNILGAVSDLRAASELLDWDMRTYMAPGSIDSRSLQLATLGETAHEKTTSREFGKLIGKLARKAKKLDPDSDERRLIEKVSKKYEKERRISPPNGSDATPKPVPAQTPHGNAPAKKKTSKPSPRISRNFSISPSSVSPGLNRMNIPMTRSSTASMKASPAPTSNRSSRV